MPKKYVVQLKSGEREQLLELIQKGQSAAHSITHAHILLKADCGENRPSWTDNAIAEAFEVSIATIERVRRDYAQQGLDTALKRKTAMRHRARRLDGVGEAHLIALACSEPPPGHARWAMRLLAGRMVELEYVAELSHETVRRTLKKTNSSPG
jgi:transposase